MKEQASKRYRWLRRTGIALLALLAALPGMRTEAHDHHHHMAEVSTQQVRLRQIPDLSLTDQDGHQVRFLTDVLRQRPAIISFIYTRCTTTCPLVGATVATVTEKLHAPPEKLAIVSISIDPDYDTPDRLLEWRKLYGDIPQWTLLTGPKREINQLLRAFGAYSSNLEDHSEILLIGPDASGQWIRMSSLEAWENVAAQVRAAALAQP
ncbi:SCO family protein [Bradyrhizobium diazoefficiens]|nr:SCO family protein [Bradyrhizobium diazoefficiens]MBR0848848.1 SCO family protein [Bradyrhizobium diazoefficiens]